MVVNFQVMNPIQNSLDKFNSFSVSSDKTTLNTISKEDVKNSFITCKEFRDILVITSD